jgi:formate hydrogenlyase subunit 3/multisubunit Na+/H+ antiporter MnhD subunit
MVLIGWLIALAIFFGFIILLRYLEHRERMALITQGINPHSIRKQRRSKGILRAGLITMMVGLTLTLGLYPLGFLLPSAFTAAPFHLGPWLLPGLIPFGVGAALTISYYLEQNAQPPNEDKDAEGKEKVIPIQDHLDNDWRERP